MYMWEEKSAYEERGPITGVQVETDGKKINRIKFAFNHIFEAWRATAWTRGDKYMGEEGVEEDQLLLEEGEQVVEVTTYTDRGYGQIDLCGLELFTSSDRRVIWGKRSGDCKRSVTKETFLASSKFDSQDVTGGRCEARRDSSRISLQGLL